MHICLFCRRIWDMLLIVTHILPAFDHRFVPDVTDKLEQELGYVIPTFSSININSKRDEKDY